MISQKALIVIIAALVLLLVIAMYAYSVYSVNYPGPDRPDGDFQRLINIYNSFDKSFWFRNNPCVFNQYLSCVAERFIIYTSGGNIVYDSVDTNNWKRPPKVESAKAIRNSFEYIRAMTTTQAVALRDNTLNLAELAKNGDEYRLVHISNYIYTPNDSQF